MDFPLAILAIRCAHRASKGRWLSSNPCESGRDDANQTWWRTNAHAILIPPYSAARLFFSSRSPKRCENVFVYQSSSELFRDLLTSQQPQAPINPGADGSTLLVVIDATTREEKPERRRFATMPSDLRRLSSWLREQGVKEAVIAYASHCTSLGRCETFSKRTRLDNLTPLAFLGGSGPGSS